MTATAASRRPGCCRRSPELHESAAQKVLSASGRGYGFLDHPGTPRPGQTVTGGAVICELKD